MHKTFLPVIRHSRLPAGNALWVCQNFFFLFYFFFLFFRRQGFRMITFDRQAGPLQNFNRSHVMVIGRSVLFSDPARPPGGGVGRPKHPKIPPPRKINFCLHAFQNPRNIFEKKFSREKKTKFFAPPPPPPKKIFFFWRFKTPGTFLSEKKILVQYSTSPPPPPPARPRPVLRTLTPILVQ